MALVHTTEHGEKLVHHVTSQLATDLGAVFSHQTIEQFVTESLQSLGSARVQTYLPLLIHRSARQQLIAGSSGVERDRVSPDQ